jgi:hypothetical protein
MRKILGLNDEKERQELTKIGVCKEIKVIKTLGM